MATCNYRYYTHITQWKDKLLIKAISSRRYRERFKKYSSETDHDTDKKDDVQPRTCALYTPVECTSELLLAKISIACTFILLV